MKTTILSSLAASLVIAPLIQGAPTSGTSSTLFSRQTKYSCTGNTNCNGYNSEIEYCVGRTGSSFGVLSCMTGSSQFNDACTSSCPNAELVKVAAGIYGKTGISGKGAPCLDSGDPNSFDCKECTASTQCENANKIWNDCSTNEGLTSTQKVACLCGRSDFLDDRSACEAAGGTSSYCSVYYNPFNPTWCSIYSTDQARAGACYDDRFGDNQEAKSICNGEKPATPNPGGNTGTNPGGNTGTNPGGNTGTNPGGNTGTNPGGNTGTNPGGNTGTNPGGNTGTNPGGNTGSNPGGNTGGPIINPGSGSGTGSGTGTGSGSGTSTNINGSISPNGSGTTTRFNGTFSTSGADTMAPASVSVAAVSFSLFAIAAFF